MKMKPRTLLILFLVMLPFAFYATVVVTNNHIADRIVERLESYPPPADTALVDADSLAGKLVGNGNGMQYVGTILISSTLDVETLTAYYQAAFPYIEVIEQTDDELIFQGDSRCQYEHFIHNAPTPYYTVICWDDKRQEQLGSFISTLLDLDLRGY
ncbi:MAG: hypothetical protein E7534_02555 [Ruminococcaceae bacterium]|nr:hypothetical protein [Oscillospiraceae bacterium]